MGQGVMGVGTMATSDAAVPTGTVLNSFSLSDRATGESSHHHPMAINMDNTSTTGDCQPECDCCPGSCSVYLPNNVAASNFPPSNLALAESAFQGTVGTRTRLFRPPFPTKTG